MGQGGSAECGNLLGIGASYYCHACTAKRRRPPLTGKALDEVWEAIKRDCPECWEDDMHERTGL